MSCRTDSLGENDGAAVETNKWEMIGFRKPERGSRFIPHLGDAVNLVSKNSIESSSAVVDGFYDPA